MSNLPAKCLIPGCTGFSGKHSWGCPLTILEMGHVFAPTPGFNGLTCLHCRLQTPYAGWKNASLQVVACVPPAQPYRPPGVPLTPGPSLSGRGPLPYIKCNICSGYSGSHDVGCGAHIWDNGHAFVTGTAGAQCINCEGMPANWAAYLAPCVGTRTQSGNPDSPEIAPPLTRQNLDKQCWECGVEWCEYLDVCYSRDEWSKVRCAKCRISQRRS